MPTVILLSSSPPRGFARSPTPADVSSPHIAPTVTNSVETPSRKRFKNFEPSRDRFPGGFSSARLVLGDKNHDVNKIISSSPGRNKFKTALNASHDDRQPITTERVYTGTVLERTTSTESPEKQNHQGKVTGVSTDEDTSSKMSTPVIVQRAVSRRTDWTPPKPDTSRDAQGFITEHVPTFPTSLLGSFEYKSDTTSTTDSFAVSEAGKRQKLDSSIIERRTSLSAKGTGGLAGKNNKITTKRSKSPAKKSLTITGLATSNFLGKDKSQDSHLEEYLVSPHAQSKENVVGTELFDAKVKQTKAAINKIRGSKKGRPKSQLVSPSTALKHLDAQEAIFGSASQLVSERPVPRTISTKETNFLEFSDPFSSPPHSSLKSVESVPQYTGTSRFKKSRNLWSAAGRDEDNALLHVDTIDLTNSPEMRDAFAGKDVMTESVATHSKVGQSCRSGAQSSSFVAQKRPSILDIDDVVTSGNDSSSRHAFHTTAQESSPRKGASVTASKAGDQSVDTTAKHRAANSKKVPPKKPHYAGLSDHDLKKQISAYGFKTVKKREKMVELLEKCWTEKYGVADASDEREQEESGFGDILSHIHDVSARPAPKVKKTPKPRKKKEVTTKTTPVKKPRQRKAKIAEGEATSSTTKRKTKASNLSEERIYDIEDLNDPAVIERRELGRFDDWARPPKKAKLASTLERQLEPPTPPLSFPQTLEEPIISSTDLVPPKQPADMAESIVAKAQEQPLATPEDSQQPEILEQITRAINHESFTSNVHLTSPSKHISSTLSVTKRRNHQVSPTWHEKILMYDPIILEDLATWLNIKGLGDIGEDREVSALEVRTWCESRGICCLRKGGWRGQKGDD